MRTSRILKGFLGLFLVFTAMLADLPAWGQVIISEFRVRGPSGANDEFIELYNNSGADHTVAAASGTGYGVAASDGVTRCVIPNGTVIPKNGTYLCVNSIGYSLASYPAGNGTNATGDATYVTDIPDNAGIAVFNNDVGGGSYILANRLDAVGSTSEANAVYKEGTGYPALTPFSIDYSFYRDTCGKGGSITTFGLCPQDGNPKDTGNNAADFVFVDTNGTSAGAGQRLGAPGPQNLSSPTAGTSSISQAPLDSCGGDLFSPNYVRDFTSVPSSNSTFGTVDIRRTFTNNTGGDVTRLRYRVIDITTFPAPSGFADLRPLTSADVVVTVDRPPCGTGTSDVTVLGTTLEQPPSQPNGGGFNSSFGSGTVTLATPLANGASIDVRFLFGVQQTEKFKVGLVIEGLPLGGGTSDTVLIECDPTTTCFPVVSSIKRVDADPTDAATVDYKVVFSQTVTGVDNADFVLTTTGSIAGTSVASVTGTGTTYTVTVNTGTGDGTIRLDVADDDSIASATPLALGGAGAGNGDFILGEVYTLNHLTCGDGNVDTGEECDDGNADNTDACVGCLNAICGDSNLQAGVEECDDGNLLAGDGCDSACQIESACGDGTVDAGETCDDGNTAPGDGCDATCQTEVGPACGNGSLDAGETCDDGNTASGDGCSAACAVEAGTGTGNDLVCSNPSVLFLNLTVGVPVEVSAPDASCGGPAPLTLKGLHASCACAWSVTPSLGDFSNAAACDTTFTPVSAGSGQMAVAVDCGVGPGTQGTFLQALTVNAQPAPGSGGCSLIR